MMRLLVLFVLLASRAWAAPSTTYVYAFGRPLYGMDNIFVAADPPACNSWVPDTAIVGATSISWFMSTAAGGGNNCSVSIYNDTGSTLITSSGSQACGSLGTVSVTGLSPFTLASGTKYQVCVCGSTGLHFLSWDDGAIGGGSQLRNALSVPLSFQGTNNCDISMNPPSSLGTFSSGNRHMPIVLIGTSTP